MQRVFHIPSHLDYVRKLVSGTYRPVAAPSGGPLRVSDLLGLRSWDFFDVLHLHTVELATGEDLVALATRLRELNKGFVFTLHDLVPNIEIDSTDFVEKTRIVLLQTSRVITLTHAAAQQVNARFGIEPSIIPHGYAVPPDRLTQSNRQARGLLVFGAIRPNRDLLGLVRAWRQLSVVRPPLRILLRSLGAHDQQRYAGELSELAEAADAEDNLTLEVGAGMLSPDELVDRCEEAGVLVLPYRTITHSGQLELARDIGLTVVAPDVSTLHAQLDETVGDDHRCVWFPADALRVPTEFAAYLERASEIANTHADYRLDFLRYRIREHEMLLARHSVEYELSCERR